MAGIASLSALINLATGGGGQAAQLVNFHKAAVVPAAFNGGALGTIVAGQMVDLWPYGGQPGGASAVPTTNAVVNNATAGAWGQTTPSAATDLYLCSVFATASVAGSLVVYDRLVQHGGFSGTTTGAQTTNISSWPALTRFTSGVGVELAANIYTSVGSTATTITASYSNTTPTSGKTTQSVAFGGASNDQGQRLILLPLAVGDFGVTSVASATIAASTLTAGNFGMTLLKPLAVLPLPLAGVGRLWSAIMVYGGPLDLGTVADSCITLAWVPNTTTAPTVFGQAAFVTV